MKFPIVHFIFGSIMMLAITGLVYSFIGDSKEACKDNTDTNIFNKCVQVMNDVKNVVSYGWILYLSAIPLFFITQYRTKNINEQVKVKQHNSCDALQNLRGDKQ